MIRAIVIAIFCLTSVARAGGMITGDALLDQARLSDLLVGRTMTFYDDGRSVFARNGDYSYTYFQGGTALGRFEIGTDGAVCIAFQNGFSRCDIYVMNNDRLIMITKDGTRFPIKKLLEN